MTSRIITIAGRPGSGKSTTAKGVAERLEYKHFSSGDLFRTIAKEQGNDVLQANIAAEHGEGNISQIDYLVDQRLREIGESEDKIVVDSRTAWHWIPNSFKVFLDLDLSVAADRILKEMTPERMAVERIPSDRKAYAQVLQERLDSETRRYKKLYGINPYDVSNYDLVVDTDTNNIEQVIALVVESYKKSRNV